MAEEPVVVLITTDPRLSHRAFEAMRIGTGVLAGENEVTFVLVNGAVHLLDDDTEDLIDGDDIARFRSNLHALDVPFHVEASAIPPGSGWNTEGLRVVPVSRERIADLVRGARRFLIF